MITAATGQTTCGARRPGWEHGPAIGIHRIPCVLDPFHQDDHANAFGLGWERNPEDCPPCVQCHTRPLLPVRVGAVPTGSGPAWPVWACLSCATAVRRLLLGK